MEGIGTQIEGGELHGRYFRDAQWRLDAGTVASA
jgi:hypothetical protein